MNFLFAYIVTIVPFAALDVLWIGFLAPGFYKKELGFLIMDKPLVGPAVAFYALYALAVVLLVLFPSIKEGAFIGVIWRGALLGFVSYGVYDLTNQATIANWPIGVTVVDMAWGAFATMLAACIAYAIIAWRS
jgi:uncharacterized membrane protein